MFEVRTIKRQLRSAGFKEITVTGNGIVRTSGFKVVRWDPPAVREVTFTVRYCRRPNEARTVDELVLLNEAYLKALLGNVSGWHPALHVNFPCSAGGVHICLVRAG